MNLRKKFISNLSYAFLAQSFAMFISILVNLVLPKVLGVESYSYWQLFIFYSQYIPFLTLGLNDGVYLRYGGISYENLDKSKIKSQLFLGLVYQLLLCIILCLVSWALLTDSKRIFIIMLACVCFMFFTIQNYLGYIFQAANETAWFSKSIIFNRIVFLIFMLVFLCLGKFTFWFYIFGYIIAQISAMLYTVVKGRTIILSHLGTLRNTIRELKESISTGSKLMLANIASMLILGIGRQIIDLNWGLLVFGKISFSITLTNFILTFIQQIGMVMFPMLRQLKSDKQKEIYDLCRLGMFFILPIIFIGYFPLKLILSLWLPNYIDSFHYLALMLPICFFDTKMQMLCNTYLKVLRKEQILFNVNLIAMIISLVIGLIGGFVLDSINMVVIGMVISIALRSIIAENYLAKNMGISVNSTLRQEIIFVILFMIIAWFLPEVYGIIFITILYFLLVFGNLKKLKQWFEMLLEYKS